MTSKLQALFNAVIVKQIEETESTYGNIIVPDMGKENSLQGEVYVAGPGHYNANGDFIATTVQPGDIVILPQVGSSKITYKGQEYLVCRENDILAVIADRNLNYSVSFGNIEDADENELPF